MPLPSIAPDSRRAWIAGVAAAAANGTGFGTAYTFGTFFDSMAEEFGTERGSTALLFGLTLLFFFGFGVVSGPLSDRFGHHRLLAVGGALFVGGLTLTSQAATPEVRARRDAPRQSRRRGCRGSGRPAAGYRH